MELLQKQDASTSNAIIGTLQSNPTFAAVARAQTKAILARDEEDAVKLASGVQAAIDKGALSGDVKVEPTTVIDVLGKTSDQVADEIKAKLPADGSIVILQGLSGTGKGTTVAKLETKLKDVVCWSNGNIFRSLTLLAVTHCEKKGIAFSSDVLTAELLQEFMGMLSFGKFGPEGAFDTKISGSGTDTGEDMLVSQVQNTVLKESRIGKNIPTVAGVSQGEVVAFAGKAVKILSDAGRNVIMEGRSQTLDHVRSPTRFELTLSDTNVIGQRRAAQVIGALALQQATKGGNSNVEQELQRALDATLKEMGV
jgi:cytidylate kinase